MTPADPDRVIAAARSWLGTPYHDQASLRRVGCDCLGLARGVWREVVGPEPFPIPPYSRDWGETESREILAEGARLDSLRITSSTEGAVIPRVYGRMRIGGNIIWATDFREETRTTTQRGGGKGGGPRVRTTEYLYYASFAVALSEGTITGIGRIWADGKPLDLSGITWRWYPGDDAQQPDPFIMARMGGANTPAYRGTAYVMFEDLPLGDYGNRIPQLTFEVFRPLVDPDTVEGLTRAVTPIPSAGEFTYARWWGPRCARTLILGQCLCFARGERID